MSVVCLHPACIAAPPGESTAFAGGAGGGAREEHSAGRVLRGEAAAAAGARGQSVDRTRNPRQRKTYALQPVAEKREANN